MQVLLIHLHREQQIHRHLHHIRILLPVRHLIQTEHPLTLANIVMEAKDVNLMFILGIAKFHIVVVVLSLQFAQHATEQECVNFAQQQKQRRLLFVLNVRANAAVKNAWGKAKFK